MYNSIVFNQQELQAIENSPYFSQRLTEAQLAEERAEAKAEGIAEGKAEGIAEGKAEGIVKGAIQLAELLRKGHDVDTALKMIEQDINK